MQTVTSRSGELWTAPAHAPLVPAIAINANAVVFIVSSSGFAREVRFEGRNFNGAESFLNIQRGEVIIAFSG